MRLRLKLLVCYAVYMRTVLRILALPIILPLACVGFFVLGLVLLPVLWRSELL